MRQSLTWQRRRGFLVLGYRWRAFKCCPGVKARVKVQVFSGCSMRGSME
ncbi:hypothetical protein AALP_AA8G435300 [Arabis alpina]|uniref:Uncharacterized protein n=1 Tax=Arabis alpina TaxID=50452 RepID=A0A087GD77_ARAAL|nr:hypothetical protein AALP_AA8G435300 [Arabis alpina]